MYSVLLLGKVPYQSYLSQRPLLIYLESHSQIDMRSQATFLSLMVPSIKIYNAD